MIQIMFIVNNIYFGHLIGRHINVSFKIHNQTFASQAWSQMKGFFSICGIFRSFEIDESYFAFDGNFCNCTKFTH